MIPGDLRPGERLPQFLTGSRVVTEDVEISFAAVVPGDEADSPERMVRSKDDTLRNVRAGVYRAYSLPACIEQVNAALPWLTLLIYAGRHTIRIDSPSYVISTVLLLRHRVGGLSVATVKSDLGVLRTIPTEKITVLVERRARQRFLLDRRGCLSQGRSHKNKREK